MLCCQQQSCYACAVVLIRSQHSVRCISTHEYSQNFTRCCFCCCRVSSFYSVLPCAHTFVWPFFITFRPVPLAPHSVQFSIHLYIYLFASVLNAICFARATFSRNYNELCAAIHALQQRLLFRAGAKWHSANNLQHTLDVYPNVIQTTGEGQIFVHLFVRFSMQFLIW